MAFHHNNAMYQQYRELHDTGGKSRSQYKAELRLLTKDLAKVERAKGDGGHNDSSLAVLQRLEDSIKAKIQHCDAMLDRFRQQKNFHYQF